MEGKVYLYPIISFMVLTFLMVTNTFNMEIIFVIGIVLSILMCCTGVIQIIRHWRENRLYLNIISMIMVILLLSFSMIWGFIVQESREYNPKGNLHEILVNNKIKKDIKRR